MVSEVLDLVLHMGSHISNLANFMGPWLYFFLFLIIFCETGLVVMPFLPGDSLLFSLGSICAVRPDLLDLKLLCPLLIGAAILGDAVNFSFGHFCRRHFLKNSKRRFLNERHLEKAELFYKKYGGKAIFLARFLPIIRTYAPFVAGLSLMPRLKFIYYNIFGAFIWICMFLFAGFFFGETEIVKQNFSMIMLAIILLSMLPIFYEIFRKFFCATPAVSFQNGTSEVKD